MATITISKAYVDSFGNLKLAFAEELPAIHYDAVSKSASEVAVHEIAIHFRAVIAQLLEARPELADVYNQIKFAKADKAPAMMSAFVRLITTGATWDVEPKKHSAGEQFEDGTVARYDGYTYSIASATFADAVEAKLQPKSIEDDLAMFGF